MRRTTIAISLLLAGSWAHAQQPVADCNALPPAAMQAGSPGTPAPIAPELAALTVPPLGTPSGVLAQAYDEAQSLDQILLRQRFAHCQNVASVLPSPSPATVVPGAMAPAAGNAIAPAISNVVVPAAPGTTVPGADVVIDPATYQKRTEFDNTPWRFNMSQNGQRMTADAFSAWMKARGVRVARGAPGAAAAAATVVTPEGVILPVADTALLPGPAAAAPPPAAPLSAPPPGALAPAAIDTTMSAPTLPPIAPPLPAPSTTPLASPAPLDPSLVPVTGLPPGSLAAPVGGTMPAPVPTTIATGSPLPVEATPAAAEQAEPAQPDPEDPEAAQDEAPPPPR